MQELYTAVGLIKRNGTLAEANTYDGYGEVDQWGYRGERSEREPPATGKAGTDAGVRAATCPQGASTKRATGGFDFNRDGDVDATDADVMNGLAQIGSGNPTTDPTGDWNMDGDVDGDATTGDLKAFNDAMTGSGTPPITLNVSALSNPYHFTGRRLFQHEDPAASVELAPNRQLQYNRNRFYKPDDGRWLQRDPVEYVDWMNLYEYVRTSPARLSDPDGRAGTDPHQTGGCPCTSPGECVWQAQFNLPLGTELPSNKLNPRPSDDPRIPDRIEITTGSAPDRYAKSRVRLDFRLRPRDCGEYKARVQVNALIKLTSVSGNDMSGCSLRQAIVGRNLKTLCGESHWDFNLKPNDIVPGDHPHRWLTLGSTKAFAWLYDGPGRSHEWLTCEKAMSWYDWTAEVSVVEAPDVKFRWGFSATFNYPPPTSLLPIDGTVNVSVSVR